VRRWNKKKNSSSVVRYTATDLVEAYSCRLPTWHEGFCVCEGDKSPVFVSASLPAAHARRRPEELVPERRKAALVNQSTLNSSA